jgi:hypothetical protein
MSKEDGLYVRIPYVEKEQHNVGAQDIRYNFGNMIYRYEIE